jgi:nitrate reductase gamma subunit
MAFALAILTYIAYAFIIVMYARKAMRYARMPVHLRWDLYSGVHVDGDGHVGPPHDHLTGKTKLVRNRFLKGFLFLLKDNFYLGEYFHKNRGYWFVLFPWHVGFILIITLHILCFFAALSMILGLSVSPDSLNPAGRILYYVILVTGVGSFATGSFGSAGMIVKRLTNRQLRAYASPVNYFNYLFLLAVFLSGFYAWYFVDPTFSEYRVFWRGLITLTPRHVAIPSAIHIVLFAFLLLYLPFTRSMHYITRFFSFLWVYWDDRPNVRGSAIEETVQGHLNQPVSWSAPHIPSGKRWVELASEATISSPREPRV